MRRWFLKVLASLPFTFGAARAAAEPTPSIAPPSGNDPVIGAPFSEAEGRRISNQAVLQTEGVPINQYLPEIETEAEALRRPVAEVAGRALALLAVAAKAQGAPKATIDGMIKNHDLAADFSPKERTFIADAAPSDRDRSTFVWRYEAAWALLWALGYVTELEKPTHPCDPNAALRPMMLNIRRSFIDMATLRPMVEILDQADRIYCYHWATREAQLQGRPAPAGLSEDVIMERHQAFNWLIGYNNNAPWDDVPTDT